MSRGFSGMQEWTPDYEQGLQWHAKHLIISLVFILLELLPFFGISHSHEYNDHKRNAKLSA